MNTYLFYTDEGYTVAPDNSNLDSLQILGIEEGNSREEAIIKLFRNNTWINRSGFSESKISSYVIMNQCNNESK